MKKWFTLSLSLLFMSAPMWAQDDEDDEIDNTFQFVLADGTVVAHNATINVSDVEVETNPFTGESKAQIKTGLYVNTTDINAYARLNYIIDDLPNGQFQVCFPIACTQQSAEGAFQTPAGTLPALTMNDLQCEWFPTAYGVCQASLQLEVMTKVGRNYFPLADGPKVNLTFNYQDPAGVAAVMADAAEGSQYFTPGGRQLGAPQKGLNIVRLQDGRTVKRLVK